MLAVQLVCIYMQGIRRAVSLSVVDMWCMVERVTCHWVSSGDSVCEPCVAIGPHVPIPTCRDPDEPWNWSGVNALQIDP